MARTLEELVKQTLAEQMWTALCQRHQIETLTEQLAQKQRQPSTPDASAADAQGNISHFPAAV